MSQNFILKKNVNLIRFLNKKPGIILRIIFSIPFFFICLAVTRRFNLATDIVYDLWNGNFKETCRRIGKYISIVYNNFGLADDQLFYFPKTENSKILNSQILMVDHLLSKNKGKSDNFKRLLSEKLVIQSAIINNSLNCKNKKVIPSQIKYFFDLADNYLSFLNPKTLNEKPNRKVKTSKKKNFYNFKNVGMECLRDFHNLMQSNSLEWFVTGGTCLGLARHNTLLPHDFDVDVGIFFEKKIHEKLLEVFKKSDIFECIKLDFFNNVEFKKDLWLYKNDPAFLKIVHKNGVNLDIFFHYYLDQGKNIIHGSSAIGWINKSFNLKNSKIEDLNVLHPNPLNKYLKEHYGDWSIVKKDFSCSVDTSNIYCSKSFSGVAVNMRRLSPELCNRFPNRKRQIISYIKAGIIKQSKEKLVINRKFFNVDQIK